MIQKSTYLKKNYKLTTPGAANFSPGQLAAVWYKTKDALLYLGGKQASSKCDLKKRNRKHINQSQIGKYTNTSFVSII